MQAGDVWRFAINGVLRQQQVVNVWHARAKTSSADPVDLANGLIDQFYGYRNTSPNYVWSGDLVFNLVQCRSLAIPSVAIDETVGFTGGDSTDAVPNQVAVVLTLRTGYAGRSYRGRIFLPGLVGIRQTDSVLATGVAASIETNATNLLSVYGPSGSDPDWELGVWSRVLGQSPAPPATPTSFNLTAGFHPITEIVCRNVLYTQRRRTIGVGS